jgi:hypothetical protein
MITFNAEGPQRTLLLAPGDEPDKFDIEFGDTFGGFQGRRTLRKAQIPLLALKLLELVKADDPALHQARMYLKNYLDRKAR